MHIDIRLSVLVMVFAIQAMAQPAPVAKVSEPKVGEPRSGEPAPGELGLRLPDTGIGGVYEVIVGVADEAKALQHFALFGFGEIKRATIDAKTAQRLYGVDSKLTSIRLQNGPIDSHGLLRLWVWDEPTGPGVGYAPPETIGQRLSVLMVDDIIRLHDVFSDARKNNEAWLPIEPVFADLFGQSDAKPGLHKRRIGVRESGVYGELFNHVFFQRYGYAIQGYGTLNRQAPLPASEFTHHDFIIDTDIKKSTDYYAEVLGMKPENAGVIDGDWLEGPRKVFGMVPGGSHYYRGFVSPNNICGKLKFFRPRDVKADRRQDVHVGALGNNLHSFFVDDPLALSKALRRAGIRSSRVQANEFGEWSVVFQGPDQVNWQILANPRPKNAPTLTLKIDPVNN